MKKIFVFIAFAIVFQSSFAALSVQVDERSELLSIVCRLAGYKEYANNYIKSYTDDIDSCFTPYSTLPMIEYAKEIRKTNGIGYDAISALIPYMEITNKKIVFTKEAFKAISEKDSRWNVEILRKYVVLLSNFYKETNFNRFFRNHTSLYEIAKVRFNEAITHQLNLSWFDDTFGVSNVNFHIVLSPCNGSSNYGASDGKNNCYAIIGAGSDSLKLPYYSSYFLSVVIHELCHSYCNPICSKYRDEMLPVFDTLFSYAQKNGLDKAYGKSYTLMYENLVRLSVLLYLSDQKALNADFVNREEQSGFPWMGNLYFFYSNFRDNRNIYPDFESFMPEYVLFMKGIAGQIDKIIADLESKIPRVVSVFPPNGSTVSSQIKEVQIMFNVPMRSQTRGVRPIDNDAENRVGFLLPSSEAYPSQNKKTIVIPVNLKENTKYGCFLTTFFRSEEGYDATEEYEWKFDTK